MMNARGSRRGGGRWLESTLALLLLLSAASAFLPAATRTAPPRPGATSVPSREAVPAPNARSHGRCISVNGGRMPTTALAAVQMPGMIVVAGATIAKFYKAFPLAAGFLTASTKACFADRLAQYRDVCVTKFDVRRNIAMMLYSGLVLGCSVEMMYNHAFPIMFGTEQTLRRAIKMTLFDGFVNAPLLWLPPAYIAKALVYRYPKREALDKYVCDVKENGLLTKYWSLWLPVSMINFCFVPAHFRVAFVAMVSFFWMIILSLVANAEGDAESCPVEPEVTLPNPRALD